MLQLAAPALPTRTWLLCEVRREETTQIGNPGTA